jgi:glycyl-tRNA synthetase
LDNSQKSMEKIVALCKGRGYVYAGSEIYGGLANTWDYGPLGVELKNNIKKAWWKKFVQENPYNVGLDSAILMNPQVWVASGHVGGFSDPLMDCKNCKTRHRADNLIEDQTKVNPAGWSNEQMLEFIREKGVKCPSCGSTNFTDIRKFNLMFKTFQGVTETAQNEIYLRPETAQGIFVNFANEHIAHHPPQAALWSLSGGQKLSATKLPPATLSSAPGNLSRWSWNSSASREYGSCSGSTTGRTYCQGLAAGL